MCLGDRCVVALAPGLTMRLARTAHLLGSGIIQAILMASQTSCSTFVVNNVSELKGALRQEFGKGVRVWFPLAVQAGRLVALGSRVILCENPLYPRPTNLRIRGPCVALVITEPE
jgi:hypothetical protein